MKTKLLKIATSLIGVGVYFWLLSVINCLIQIVTAVSLVCSGTLGWFGGIVWWIVGTALVDSLLIIHAMRMINKKIEK